MSPHFVLRVSKVNEAERSSEVARGLEMIVLSPVNSVSYAISVKRIGCQFRKSGGVVVSFVDIAFKIRGVCFESLSFQCSTV